MFKWAMLAAVLAATLGCLLAMGAGWMAVAKLFGALFAMTCVSALIAFPFLRNRPR
jgi:hypothetical protein